MRYLNIISRVAVLPVMVLASCTRSPITPLPMETKSLVSTQLPPETAALPPTMLTSSEPTQKEYEDFNSNNFDQSIRIDNQWLPLKPGTQFVFEGFTNEGDKRVPRRLVSTITDLTKLIDGVRTVVTWDQDYSADELVEAELAFFAQDKDGNVWRMGEHPEDYENGQFVGASTWISGIDNSRAGIEMQGQPKVGTASYSQGWAPGVDFTDRAQVSQVGQKVCVKPACYEDVLVTDETSKAEPGAHQLKYYASDIGNIKVDWKGADQTQETMELVDIIHLSPEASVGARAAAVVLEKHAYEVSPEVYGQTLPSEYPDGTPVTTVKVNPASQNNSSIPTSPSSEVVIYATDLQQNALSELDVLDDPASPGGKMVGLSNNGDELNAPPEDDPHAIFKIRIQSGIPYRCWIHMKVGAPKGISTANLIWVQITDAVNKSKEEILKPGTDNYLTAQGSQQPGWAWVGCDLAGTDPLIYFKNNGEVTVRLHAGMEGVGFDQFVLSSARFLEKPPSQPIVAK